MVRVTEILADAVLILVFLGFFSIYLVNLINLLGWPFGFSAAFTEGYSMCAYDHYGYDYLSLSNTRCAYEPGNILITYRKWPPDVGSVACGIYDNVGVVCHRVSRFEGDKVCLVGDNPRAIPEFCVPYEKYYGQVVAKLPRFVGVPGLAIVVSERAVIDFLTAINAGEYPSLTTNR